MHWLLGWASVAPKTPDKLRSVYQSSWPYCRYFGLVNLVAKIDVWAEAGTTEPLLLWFMAASLAALDALAGTHSHSARDNLDLTADHTPGGYRAGFFVNAFFAKPDIEG